MRIAITADLHLTSRAKAPQRYAAFEDILAQAIEMHIETILIAGDVFDASLRDYSEFDALCQDPNYRHLQFHAP
jgi:DNA repair exonuclease SbcCD nuclease subunit